MNQGAVSIKRGITPVSDVQGHIGPILPSLPSLAALRVVRERPGLSRALLAGVAGGRWRRGGAGGGLGCRVGLVVGLVPVVGSLPGCGALDLARILALGFFVGVLNFLWSEL